MNAIRQRIVNRLQSRFPVVSRPFAAAGEQIGLGETELIGEIKAMLAEGLLSRFGPMYNAERLGGAVTLAAMEIPPPDFERIAAVVNALPEVSQNYARDHALNMWFVLSVERPELIGESIARIEAATGLPVFNFPKLEEFYIGFRMRVGKEGPGAVSDDAPPPPPPPEKPTFDAVDRRILIATQEGLPLVATPYAALAHGLELAEEDVMTRIDRMTASKVIRRMGAVPDHYRLGLGANGMTVWDVPAEEISRLGQQVGALDFVTHCYHRPPAPPRWPYALFAMVHGASREEAMEKANEIAEILGPHNRGHAVLFSSRLLKKTGLRLRA